MAAVFFVFYSCSKEENNNDTGFTHGVFIVNEGAYGNNNGSITYYDKKNLTVENHLFQTANEMRSLGDVVQSFSVIGDMGFIVVNNSQKIEVVDMETFKSVGTMRGLDYPRYMLAVSDNKAYITNGATEGFVYLIDLSSLLINSVKRIAVGKGPEKLIMSGSKVFVANSGGWDKDSTISIIDPDNDEVIASVVVGAGATDLVEDKDGKIWVFCRGENTFDENWNATIDKYPRLVSVDRDSYSVAASYEIISGLATYNPNRLAISPDGSTLYYLNEGNIYKMNVNDQHLPAEALISGNFNAVDVDPVSGDIYVMPNKYDANATILVFDDNGRQLNSIEAGIGPNAAVFN